MLIKSLTGLKFPFLEIIRPTFAQKQQKEACTRYILEQTDF